MIWLLVPAEQSIVKRPHLGVPAVSVYAGRWAAVDQMLLEQGRLKRISTTEDVQPMNIAKKPPVNLRRATEGNGEVVKLILEE